MLFNTAHLETRIEAFKEHFNEIELNKKLIEDPIDFNDRVILKGIYNHVYHERPQIKKKNDSCGTTSISAHHLVVIFQKLNNSSTKSKKESQENSLQR